MSIPSKVYEIYRGDLFNMGFQVTDAAGTAVVLTGWTAKLIGKLNLTDADASAVFNIAATQATQSGSTTGQCTASIPGSATLPLPTAVTIIYYQWQFTDPAGAIHTLEKGIIRVQPDITIST